MPTFAQKQNQLQKPVSSNPTRSNMAALGPGHREHPVLHLQRTIGNQAVQRLLQHAQSDDLEVSSGMAAGARSFSRKTVQSESPINIQAKLTVNDLGDVYEQEADRISEQVMRMPDSQLQRACAYSGGRPKRRSKTEQPSQNTEHFQTKHVRENDADIRGAPAAVNEAVRSPGQPLDAGARAFMEPRFGHDFSRVRVHHDAKAAQSADAVNAHAYVFGNDIVFGQCEYAPETARGRSLIAHELAHVVQQRNSIDSHSELRRAAKRAKTAAGEYIADPYDATLVKGAGGITIGYGADITIKFKANKNVDAEQIAFVQMALSVKDDKESATKVPEGLKIPTGGPGAGVHIDVLRGGRIPLYGMSGSRGGELANPEPAKLATKPLAEIGWRYTDASNKLQNREAMMYDSSDLSSGDIYKEADEVMIREWRQQFETSAIAIAGNQKGTFYGSVEWGWTKSVADTQPKLLEFKTKSYNVPSSIFMEAAKLWNISVTPEKKETKDLPVDVHITSRILPIALMWDSPDKRRVIAILATGTPLGRIAKVDPKGRTGWASVIVTGGQDVGKTGWVKEGHIK